MRIGSEIEQDVELIAKSEDRDLVAGLELFSSKFQHLEAGFGLVLWRCVDHIEQNDGGRTTGRTVFGAVRKNSGGKRGRGWYEPTGRGEEHDFFWFAPLRNRKILGLQSGDRLAVLVSNDYIQQDQPCTDSDRRRRQIRGRVWRYWSLREEARGCE